MAKRGENGGNWISNKKWRNVLGSWFYRENLMPLENRDLFFSRRASWWSLVSKTDNRRTASVKGWHYCTTRKCKPLARMKRILSALYLRPTCNLYVQTEPLLPGSAKRTSSYFWWTRYFDLITTDRYPLTILATDQATRKKLVLLTI